MHVIVVVLPAILAFGQFGSNTVALHKWGAELYAFANYGAAACNAYASQGHASVFDGLSQSGYIWCVRK